MKVHSITISLLLLVDAIFGQNRVSIFAPVQEIIIEPASARLTTKETIDIRIPKNTKYLYYNVVVLQPKEDFVYNSNKSLINVLKTIPNPALQGIAVLGSMLNTPSVGFPVNIGILKNTDDYFDFLGGKSSTSQYQSSVIRANGFLDTDDIENLGDKIWIAIENTNIRQRIRVVIEAVAEIESESITWTKETKWKTINNRLFNIKYDIPEFWKFHASSAENGVFTEVYSEKSYKKGIKHGIIFIVNEDMLIPYKAQNLINFYSGAFVIFKSEKDTITINDIYFYREISYAYKAYEYDSKQKKNIGKGGFNRLETYVCYHEGRTVMFSIIAEQEYFEEYFDLFKELIGRIKKIGK